MAFWIREVVGWLLLGVGLVGYWLCFGVFLANDRAIEAGIFAGICTVIFRGGLHLIRVATAARVVLAVQNRRPKPTLTAPLNTQLAAPQPASPTAT